MGEDIGNTELRGSNGSLASPDERSRDNNGRKVPRSLSFGASSSHGSNQADGAYAQPGTDTLHGNVGAQMTQSAARPVTGNSASPQSLGKPPVIHAGMTDQQRLTAIQEVLPAVSRKVTACAACRYVVSKISS